MLRSGLDLRRAFRAWSLAAGCAALLVGAPARAQSEAPPAAEVPWGQIEAGLAQLAGGDGKAADASFRKARSGDDSGLAALLSDLTRAYVNYDRMMPKGVHSSLPASQRAHELLDVANKSFHERPIPAAVLGDALTRIRQVLKQAPPAESPSLLRPLLCNLRLLSGDRATDGEPVLEGSGKSHDMGPLTVPRGVFTPTPLFTEGARKARLNSSLVVELIVDSEGCPASEKLLKSLPYGLADQALATLRWHAYEPARYDGKAVAMKFTLTVGYFVS